jgi:SAM-dependent methyltransferase
MGSDTEIVRAGYDAIVEDYASWSSRVSDPVRDRLFDAFMGSLSPGSRVLDVGCGSGIPWTARLSAAFAVTGVDISSRQVEAARRAVPAARFVVADITAVDLDDGAFDGIAALYSIGHLPSDEHDRLIARMRRWTRPGGLLLASFPAEASAGWTGEWLGVPMYFASLGSAAYRASLDRHGWVVATAEEVVAEEPDGPARFLWVLARAGEG